MGASCQSNTRKAKDRTTSTCLYVRVRNYYFWAGAWGGWRTGPRGPRACTLGSTRSCRCNTWARRGVRSGRPRAWRGTSGSPPPLPRRWEGHRSGGWEVGRTACTIGRVVGIAGCLSGGLPAMRPTHGSAIRSTGKRELHGKIGWWSEVLWNGNASAKSRWPDHDRYGNESTATPITRWRLPNFLPGARCTACGM